MTLWGGRFEEAPGRTLWEFTVSDSDRRLLADDVEGSIAHAAMLNHVGLLSDEEHGAIESGLSMILTSARDGTFEFLATDEDVHSAVERRLTELVGEVGKKLHTGRSRNDQIALDMRLYLRRAAAERAEQLAGFGSALIDVAVEHAGTIVPAYTHLQQAQAVPFGHHLLAYAWMAVRDRQRFQDLSARLGVMPLGAGAVGGSSLSLDPGFTARQLGFEAVFANSIDAVGARDVIAEYAWCCAQAMVNLSRLAEEMVLWSTSEFAWVTISDSYTTGSSALPHKKNPDVAELARGKSAGAIAALNALLIMQKGTPLSYNRDFQEDKLHVFGADDTLRSTLVAMTGMLGSARFDPPMPTSWVTALDLAEILVGRGVPFRDAHHAVGRLVAALLAGGRDLSEATVEDLETAHPAFLPEDLTALSVEASVAARRTAGGGSPDSVLRQVDALRLVLGL